MLDQLGSEKLAQELVPGGIQVAVKGVIEAFSAFLIMTNHGRKCFDPQETQFASNVAEAVVDEVDVIVSAKALLSAEYHLCRLGE